MTFVFLLVSPTGSGRLEQDKYQLKTNKPSIAVYMICDNNDLLHREISPRMKSVKTALNARVVIFGKAQTGKDGIIRCTITISNFPMWDNATQYSY